MWLRELTGIHPRSIMSDCALAIANAVANVYLGSLDAPKHYWCLFHVLKAFRGKEKTYLGNQWLEAFTKFCNIMYSQENPTGTMHDYVLCWHQISPGFVGYVNQQWTLCLHQWAIFF
jgi:hypothetical protein